MQNLMLEIPTNNQHRFERLFQQTKNEIDGRHLLGSACPVENETTVTDVNENVKLSKPF